MAYEAPVFSIPGLEAGADLSAKQFFAVKMSTTAKRVSLCSAQGEPVLGILQNKPSAAGEAATVLALGVSKMVAGETLTAGDHWGTDANGKAVKIEHTITGADVGDYIAGVVIEGGAANELVTVTIGLGTALVPA